jgi:predicted nucleotide-binding protein
MARKSSTPARRPADLSPDQMRTAIKRLEPRVAELRSFDPNSISDGDGPEVTALEARIKSTLAQVFGEDTHEFHRLHEAWKLDLTAYAMVLFPGHPGTSVQEIRNGVDRGRQRAIALLQAEIDSLREAVAHLPALEPLAASTREQNDDGALSHNVFIVHGRDGPAKTEVARLIERAGLNAVILHEQPHAGRTIIEKFEDHGSTAGFAIVVLTPDDVGGLDADHLRPRARQNVIGEMFWFAGRLGRGRVCALVKGEVEIPSDVAGVGYTHMDDRGAWKSELLKELSAAGYEVDYRRALA